MTLIGTSVLFLAPLIYIQNQEFIDEQLNHASGVISAQATQVKDLASEHAGKGFESVKAYTGAGAAKAQELVGTAKQNLPSPTLSKSEPTASNTVHEDAFPTAPKTDLPSTEAHTSPAVILNGEPVAVS